MIQVIVKNLSGEVTNQAKFESQAEADAWVVSQVALKAFGKPERWVDSEDVSKMGEDKTKATASQQVGGPEDERTQYKFAAEFTTEASDITAQVLQGKANADAIAYLLDTDWYVLRLAETQKPIPAEVLAKRVTARAAVVHGPA